MGVAAPGSFQVKGRRNILRKLILRRRPAPVHPFQPVAAQEKILRQSPGQHLRPRRRLPPRLRQKPPPVRMRRNHHPAAAIDFPPQKIRLVHPENIPLRPENQNMPGIGINLAPRKHRKVMPPPQLRHFRRRPKSVMLRQTNPLQPQRLRPLNHLIHPGKRILRRRVTMNMQVNQQKPPATSHKNNRPAPPSGQAGLIIPYSNGKRLYTGRKRFPTQRLHISKVPAHPASRKPTGHTWIAVGLTDTIAPVR